MALTVKRVERQTATGKFLDSRGLYLQVRGGNKSWILRYKRFGKTTWLGLGSAKDVGLEEARELARKARLQIKQDIDPLQARRAARTQAKKFKDCTEAYLAAHAGKWSQKAQDDFVASFKTYVYPICGRVAVAQVEKELVTQCLTPIWMTKAPTAKRLRARIEAILDFATVQGFRSGDNPARWQKHLEFVLAKTNSRDNHHAALPYAEIPDFMAKLRQVEGTAARALEFTILTAARTGEAIGARWDEVNLAEKTWTVPASRMKAGVAHRVPLSDRALEILLGLGHNPNNELIFPISAKGMARVLQRMGHDVTVHGFRSTFRDWSADCTAHPNHVAEQALAHQISDAVERAYRRGDLLERRRVLMADWATYCQRPPTAVLPLRRAG
jgi:integrase